VDNNVRYTSPLLTWPKHLIWSADKAFSSIYKKSAVRLTLSLFRSLRGDMQARISFEGALSSPFKLKCGVKQGCVLSPILFGIFFSASSLITHSTTMTKTPPLISLKAIILARKSSATLHIFFK